MLVCVNCNVEYKEDKKFCSYCGGPLVTKDGLTSSHKDTERKEEESGQKLSCPNCKITYEFGSSCIQCGSALVSEIPTKKKEGLKKDHKKTDGEKEPLQVQKPQDQPIQKPLQKLICPTCKIIYERGDSCIKCGSALVPQISPPTKEEPRVAHQPEVEGKPIQLQTIQEQLIEAPREKLICPACKIIYERGNSCIRCGVALVIQLPPQGQEKPKLPETPEVYPERPSPPSPRGQDLGAVERAKKKEMEVSPPPEVEVKEETLQTETPEQQLTKRLTDDLERKLKLPRKRKVDYRRLFLEVGSITIMAVAGGYFLWSVYSYMTPKEPKTKAPHSKEVDSPVLPNPSPPANVTAAVSIPQETDRKETDPSSVISKEKPLAGPPPASHFTPSDVVLAETLEIEKIKGLLENIRQANLQKNIDLFISCYAMDFKDREGKKKATLAYWKKFDYLDLSYDLKNPSISGDTAKARVEWVIKISSKTGGRPQESKTILDVTLKKEEGGWKIKEVKQGG
jgi:rRNA maturation endonuclease Nob1/ketosteroid isomerase-like protein